MIGNDFTTRLYAYRIKTQFLPQATKLMNGYAENFHSRVVKIIIESEETHDRVGYSLVIVQCEGRGYIPDEWKDLIEEFELCGGGKNEK